MNFYYICTINWDKMTLFFMVYPRDHEVCIICQFYHKVKIYDRKLNYFHIVPVKHEFKYVIWLFYHKV